MGAQANIDLALNRFNHPAVTYPVFHYLMGIQEKGMINKTQAMLAEEMGLSAPSVSRALKELMSRGVVYRDGRVFRLNPSMLFNGNGDEQAAEIDRMHDVQSASVTALDTRRPRGTA